MATARPIWSCRGCSDHRRRERDRPGEFRACPCAQAGGSAFVFRQRPGLTPGRVDLKMGASAGRRGRHRSGSRQPRPMATGSYPKPRRCRPEGGFPQKCLFSSIASPSRAGIGQKNQKVRVQMSRILAAIFAVVVLGTAYGVKTYLPVLRGGAETQPQKPERPGVGLKSAVPFASSGCSAMGGRKSCKVTKPED
jgi:hypothetical protein